MWSARIPIVAWLLSLGTLNVRAAAQAIEGVAPGARVRVTTKIEGRRRIARVVAVAPDMIILQSPGADDTMHLSPQDIARLEVSRGRYRSVGQGLVTGTLIGGAFGAILGLTAGTAGGGSGFAPALSAVVPVSMGVGALAGMVIGGALGARRTEHWSRVLLPDGSTADASPHVRIRLSPAAAHPGVVVSVSSRF